MSAVDRVALLERAYALFNERKVDDLLTMMTDDVEWPDVANAAVLHGKDAIRPYWSAQFAVGDPQVHPTDYLEAGDDIVVVVDQQVLDLAGRTIVPSTIVFHRYTFEGELVRRMVVFTDRAQALSVS